MTTPSPGNAPGLPLAAYLQEMQAVAMRCGIVLDALNALMDDPEQGRLCIQLIEAAKGLADRLNEGLDSTNLPEALS